MQTATLAGLWNKMPHHTDKDQHGVEGALERNPLPRTAPGSEQPQLRPKEVLQTASSRRLQHQTN